MATSNIEQEKDNIVSVGIELQNNKILFKFNKDHKLNSVIKTICKENGVLYFENRFSLQFVRNKDSNLNIKLQNKYVTEDNREYIIDGTELKLVISAQEITKLIFMNLNSDNADVCWSLQKLAEHMNDPVFTPEFFSLCYPLLKDKYINNIQLPNKLFNYCLYTLYGFLLYDYIDDVDELLIHRLIKIIDCTEKINANTNTINKKKKKIENSLIENSLRVLEQCLLKKQYNYITNLITLENVVPLLWSQGSPSLHECTLSFINTVANYCVDHDRKSQILNTMYKGNLRQVISTNILQITNEIDKNLAEQLYIYQKIIFKIYLNDIEEPFLIDHNVLPDVRFLDENKRFSNFDNASPGSSDNSYIRDSFHNEESCDSSRRNSGDVSSTPTETPTTERTSYSWKSEATLYRKETLALSFLNLDIDFDSINKMNSKLEEAPAVQLINKLVYNCVMYFAKFYHKNYQCSLFSEGCKNFLNICNDVVNIITFNVLKINVPPVPECTHYIPTVFNATKKRPFLEELFCVVMWLFERTKREMKAASYSDYKKVLKVIERQITEGLLAKPRTFQDLEMMLRNYTYSAVSLHIEKERNEKQDEFYNKSLAVKELRSSLKCELVELVRQRRLNYIMVGTKFPVWNATKGQKVKNKFWFAKLSPNQCFILYSTELQKGTDVTDDMQSLSVKDIHSITIGKKCPHFKEYKNKDKNEIIFAFSIIIDTYENKSIDFITAHKEEYDYWVDALHALKKERMRSTLFREELNTLLDMEVRIKLLELDGIDCPLEPPPIPALPDNFEFNS